MRNDIRVTEAVIDFAGQLYKVCLLNCDMVLPQFYYHFAYPEHAKRELWNFTLQKETHRPDHISFHADGSVHLTLVRNRHHIDAGQAHDGQFLPKDKKIVTPLLVHSIYPINDEYYLPIISSEIIKGTRKINVMPNRAGFSVIIFLTPEEYAPQDFLNQFWVDIPDGRIPGSQIGSSAGRILAWNGWAIDYVISDLTLRIPKGKQPRLYHSAFAYLELNRVLGDLLIQRILVQSQY